MKDLLSNPGVWGALAIGIIAGLLTHPVGRALLGILLFLPKRVSAGFTDVVKFVPIINDARTSTTLAIAYVGAQLGFLILNCSLAILGAACWYIVTLTPTGWVAQYRIVLLVVVIIAEALFIFRIAKRMVMLRLLYQLEVTPPQPTPNVASNAPQMRPESPVSDSHSSGGREGSP